MLGIRILLVWRSPVVVYSMCTDVSTCVGSDNGKLHPVREDEVD